MREGTGHREGSGQEGEPLRPPGRRRGGYFQLGVMKGRKRERIPWRSWRRKKQNKKRDRWEIVGEEVKDCGRGLRQASGSILAERALTWREIDAGLCRCGRTGGALFCLQRKKAAVTEGALTDGKRGAGSSQIHTLSYLIIAH